MEELLTKVGCLIQDLEPKLKEAELRAENTRETNLRAYNQGRGAELVLILHDLRRLYAAIQAKL
tara:strand:- start:64 stop:255 length:192 start_codon:yes stop_codon:yes gene_type:complete